MAGKFRGSRLAVISTLCLVGLILISWWYKSVNPPSKSPVIPNTARERILVIAPHPDDESLGAGGLINHAVNRDGSVRVVFMTNGDGSHYGVMKFTGHTVVKANDYLFYGRQRQKEAVQAVLKLGLQKKDIIFIGFPDQGLARLWRNYWNPDQPYTSSQTQTPNVPYQDSMAPGEAYTAPALLNSLVKIFKDYSPTAIYVTGTYDCHPDHWATGAFTLLSISSLKRENPAFNPQVYTFDIHRPDKTTTNFDKTLLPPQYFLDNGDKCYVTSLSKQTLANKKQALANYKTQIMVMPGFFRNMARRSFEVFYLNKAKNISARGSSINSDQQTETPIAFNHTGNNQQKSVSVLKAAYIFKDHQKINLRLITQGRRTDKTAYLINIYILPGNAEKTAKRYSLQIIPQSKQHKWLLKPTDFDGIINSDYQGNRIDIKIPNLLLPEEKYLMINVDSTTNGKIVDRIPWDRLELIEK